MSKTLEVSTLKLREQDLTGKVALVTGASRGIGRSVALNLSSRGCSILGTCSNTASLHHIDTLSHTVADLYKNNPYPTNAPKIVGLVADIQSSTCAALIAEHIDSQFSGHVDIFVNNAAEANVAKIGEMSTAHIQACLTGNIQTPVEIVEQLVRGKQFRKNSRIIYISSVRARKAWATQLMYMATKSAGESLCRAWADAFGGKQPEFEFMAGTTANAVMVGLTATEAVYSLPPESVKVFEDEFVPHQSVPRVGRPEDIADVVGLLCSESARWITGSVMSADGGGVHIL